MKRDFARIVGNEPVNGMEATLDDLALKVARTRGVINANTYMGQQETVTAINEFLDTLDEAIAMKRLELGAVPGTVAGAGGTAGAPTYAWETPALTARTNAGGVDLTGLVPEIPPRPAQQSPRDILSRLARDMAAGDDPLGDMSKDDMLAILDQIARRQSGETTEGMSEQTYEMESLYPTDDELPSTEEDGRITSGRISGALNPYGKEAEKHATRYYEAIDVARIAKNTGYSAEQIQRIKDFLFLEEHDLGDGRVMRFDPSYEISQSWQRLLGGKEIQPHDLTLLAHELMEKELMDKGYTQDEAHTITSKKFNYKRECEEYYGKTEGHS